MNMTGQVEKLHHTLKASINAKNAAEDPVDAGSVVFRYEFGRMYHFLLWRRTISGEQEFKEAEVLLASKSCQDVNRKTD